jgi:hypothetical protein
VLVAGLDLGVAGAADAALCGLLHHTLPFSWVDG